MARLSSRRPGFTLIELLVVVAIIAVLIGLLLPSVQKVRESMSRLSCQNNLKQLGLAIHMYEKDNGYFPRAGDPSSGLSWNVFILPYIEQGNLFNEFSLAAGTYTDANKNQYAVNRIKTFLCPSAGDVETMLSGGNNNVNVPDEVNGVLPYTTHYYGIMGPKGTNASNGQAYGFNNVGANGGFCLDGIFQQGVNIRVTDVTDGLSNTLMLGEMSWYNAAVGTRYRSWVRGCDGSDDVCAGCKNVAASINLYSIATFSDMPMGSQHPTGTNFAFGDGSVHFLRDSIDFNVYLGLASRDGNESYASQY